MGNGLTSNIYLYFYYRIDFIFKEKYILNTGILELKTKPLDIFSPKLWLMELTTINSWRKTFLCFSRKIQFFLLYIFLFLPLKLMVKHFISPEEKRRKNSPVLSMDLGSPFRYIYLTYFLHTPHERKSSKLKKLLPRPEAYKTLNMTQDLLTLKT